MKYNFEAVVIGVSAGGFKALHMILGSLSVNFPLPIIIVQHRMAGSDDYLLNSLDNICTLSVKEADEKESICPGVVYVAPADYHLLVEQDRTFSLSVDEPVCYARPAVDVLFETAADTYCERLIGVVLTGANSDGSRGIKAIKKVGGLTIAQNPESAESRIMPLAAIRTKAVDFILELEEIASFLEDILEENDDSVHG